MIIKIEFDEEAKYKKYKISKRKNGKLFCRIPVAYEIDEDGKIKRYIYKEIYRGGVPPRSETLR